MTRPSPNASVLRNPWRGPSSAALALSIGVLVVCAVSAVGITLILTGRFAGDLGANASVVTSTVSTAEELALRDRVTSFYTAWKNSDPKATLNLIAPSARGDIDADAYVANLRMFLSDAKLERFSIRTISKEEGRDTVLVETDVSVTFLNEAKRVDDIDRTRWILADDQQWYFLGKVREMDAGRPTGQKTSTRRPQ